MKLLLADDHALFRDTLVQYIKRAEPAAEVVLAEDLHEALEKLELDSNLDLIVLDLKMPGMKGLQGLEQVRALYPDVPVALMSGLAEPEDVAEAIALGAIGYFPKTLSGKALLSAIQQVLAGEQFVPMDSANQSVMPSYYADKPEIKKPTAVYKGLKLTPRENEILQHLVQGKTNKEIADALGLQVVTVKLHVRGACQKLGAKNRTQAALKAREFGVVP